MEKQKLEKFLKQHRKKLKINGDPRIITIQLQDPRIAKKNKVKTVNVVKWAIKYGTTDSKD